MTCARGHESHAKKWVHIDLGGPTGFADYCSIPVSRSFDMLVYEHDDTPGPLCPAHDAVSEMISVHGVWEPQGTALALAVLRPGDLLIDFGAHVGWYSLLARSSGARAVAWDVDGESLAMYQESARKNGWGGTFTWQGCIGPATEMMGLDPIRLAKIDIEGAEPDAVRMLWPTIEAGLVDHILIEVSPCFGPGYPELIAKLADVGYRVFRLPEKQYPPVELDDPETALAPYRMDLDRDAMADWIAGCVQADLWLHREGASW